MRGRLSEQISNAVVHMTKEFGGKGPPKCRTHVHDELVVVVMRGGYTRAEQTLFEDGKWQDVRNMRHAFQDSMEARLTEVIEKLTDRQVIAFMSSSHQDPDLQVELFVLQPPPDPEV